jgi:hypothetical protein
MTTYTLTVRVAEGREPEVDEYLREAVAHLVSARVAWTLTEQHDARPERPPTTVPQLVLAGA